MEGGQKFVVPLVASFNIDSNDTLVPINGASYNHNWQQLQGGYIANSVRYEANGWAAGWNVYNFDYKQNGIAIKDKYFTLYKDKGIYTYQMQNEETGDIDKVVKFRNYYMVLTYPSDYWFEDNVLTGMFKGKRFYITWNPETEEATLESEGNFRLDTFIDTEYLNVWFTIVDLDTLLNADFEIYLPSSLGGDDTAFVNYDGYVNGEHIWGKDAFKYNPVTSKLFIKEINSEIDVTPVDNQLSFDYDKTIEGVIKAGILEEQYYKSFELTKAASADGGVPVVANTAVTTVNVNKCSFVFDTNRRVFAPGVQAKFSAKLPVWLSVVIDAEDNTTIYHHTHDCTELYDIAITGDLITIKPKEGVTAYWAAELIINKSIKNATCTLRDKYETITKASLDIQTDATRYALPIWGNIGGQVRYDREYSKTDILTIDPKPIVIENVQITDSTQKKYLWIDRDASADMPGNINLVDSTLQNVTIDSKNNGKLNVAFALNDTDGAFYYVNDEQSKANKVYLPSILFENKTSAEGNMSVSNDDVIMSLDFKGTTFKAPKLNGLSFEETGVHKFYSEFRDFIATYSAEVVKVSSDTYNIKISFGDYADEIVLTYKNSQITSMTGAGNLITVKAGTASDLASFNIKFNKVLTFANCTGRFIIVKDSSYTLVSANNYVASIRHGTVNFDFNFINDDVDKLNAGNIQVAFDYDKRSKQVQFFSRDELGLAVNVPVAVGASISNDKLVTEFKSTEYELPLYDLSALSDYVYVTSTDVRTDKMKAVLKINAQKEIQPVRQQWNSTVETENFWWVDSTHILELTKDEFVFKRKCAELDDWNGDKWQDIYKKTKLDILPSDVTRSLCTNVYGEASALFLTFKSENDSSITCDIYDIKSGLTLLKTVVISVVNKELGKQLIDKSISENNPVFNTYSKVTASSLLSQADWTATVVDDRLMVGCHLTNNFDQWTFVYDLDTLNIVTCIQGYGYVGVKGDLTGGQIPAKYFDLNKGFTGIVQPLDSLNETEIKDYTIEDRSEADKPFLVTDISSISNVRSRIVGTDKQQWYIEKELFGIVSHLTYDRSTKKFNVEKLPITNSYTAMYKSPSFATSLMGDMGIQAFTLDSLFKLSGPAEAVWRALCVACGYPFIFMLNPRLSSFSYLQQSLGQYAYVHYNTSKSLPEKDITDITAAKNNMGSVTPALSDSMTFDKQIVEQKVALKGNDASFLGVVASALAKAFTHEPKHSVNEEVNATTMSDENKLFTQFAMEQINSLVTTNIATQSIDSGESSKVTAIKSLDMFYSTSDYQKVFAGPGFVEHQFVADCVAQSVTDVNAIGEVNQVSYVIKALSMYQISLELTLLNSMFEAAMAAAQALTWPTLISIAEGAAYLLKASGDVLRNGAELLSSFLDALSKDGVVCNQVGSVNKRSLSVEPKHKYGEKNEVFMWPCVGTPAEGLTYTDEKAVAKYKKSTWRLNLKARKVFRGAELDGLLTVSDFHVPDFSDAALNGMYSIEGLNGVYYNHEGDVPLYQISCVGKHVKRKLPKGMSKIEGVESFLPEQAFKNENIGVSEPSFAPSLIHDYVIDSSWDLTQCCTYGMQQWVTCKDTKLINCPPSNIIINDKFCGIASPYTAIELKRGLSKKYMRPWAITPTVLAFNSTGYNTILDNIAYHAFDGISYRLVDLVGAPGIGKNMQSFLYSFQINDRFKRSNKLPAMELQGNFETEPLLCLNTIDKNYTTLTISAKEKGLSAGTVGEDKDLIRYAIPLFTEDINTMPAAVKTLAAMTLGVVEGITSLCTDLANNQVAYKAPKSVDFTIGNTVFRATEEYICSVQTANGVDILTNIVPTVGMKFVGATPFEAYFYSAATRCYYIFTGAALMKATDINRFRDLLDSKWDFINQQVVFSCLMSFKRLNDEVSDKDSEVDNVVVPVISGNIFKGELPPPITTIFNDASWFKSVSLPSGYTYQGPNRVIINRGIFLEHMKDTLKSNLGKWHKVPREKYSATRQYFDKFVSVDKEVHGVKGWTHNPFNLVTSFLGMAEDTDCMFEWTLTFYWTKEMEELYEHDQYAVVNVMAETISTGGKVTNRPVHIFLNKELFTRSERYGYYSFTYQSKNGIGNRERLHIWSDAYIAMVGLDVECKPITSKRNTMLTQQIDVTDLKEW